MPRNRVCRREGDSLALGCVERVRWRLCNEGFEDERDVSGIRIFVKMLECWARDAGHVTCMRLVGEGRS
jgi:hypothetical protein